MRIIKCNPQPVLVNEGENKWLIPSDPDNPDRGGTYFTYPVFSLITGEKVPSFISREMSIEMIDGIFYWVKSFR